MTQKEAKAELNRIKESWEDIKDVDLEIERLMTVATKMTPSYEPKTSGGYSNRLEEAVIKIEDYRSRLSNLLVDDLIHRNECMKKVQKINSTTLRMVLIYYYFMDNTLEKTAELLKKSYRWTYELYLSALEEYAKIS